MVHLRIVVPNGCTDRALELLEGMPSVTNVIFLEGAARRPAGDVILCDVAREDASIVISDLRELKIDEKGAISVENIDSQIAESAIAAEKAAYGLPSDAVVWEEVESRTSENVEMSASFLVYMAVATLLAAVGIFTDQLILIIGAMVVGPEFGPLAGLCVALVHKRRDLATRSLKALAIGFPFAIGASLLFSLALDALSLVPDDFSQQNHPFTDFIASPDQYTVIVALLAGVAGVMSLTSAKSGALVGVLISVTTIPAASNVGVAAALGDTHEMLGAAGQLGLNLVSIVTSGVAVLFIQRRFYIRRKRKHLSDSSRKAAGLPGRPQPEQTGDVA